MKKIFILGGTGFTGRYLVPSLVRKGHRLSVLVRAVVPPWMPGTVETVALQQGKKWQEKVRESDVTINLAGASIAQPWTQKAKAEIYASRIETTRQLVDALPSDAQGKMLINASAIGYYGFCRDEWISESSPSGTDFAACLCKDWEAEALKAKEKGCSLFVPRMGVVLGNGGALENMVKMFNRFLGARLGSGKQWFSWLHVQDFVDALNLAIEQNRQGTYNLCSPCPVQNLELTKTLSALLRVPTLPPAPSFVLKLVLGEFSSMILEGQRVSSQKWVEETAFHFRFASLREALEDLLKESPTR